MNETLRRLDLLVGDWTAEASLDGLPAGRGRVTFAWVEGGAFLRMHAEDEPPLPTTPPGWVEHSPSPVTALFGLDDQDEIFTMLYADGRGVLRVYRSTLADGTWTMWREAPGFHQRFTGTVSGDGRTITGGWDASADGVTWTRDFDLTYTRV
jgi:hypothetical protein